MKEVQECRSNELTHAGHVDRNLFFCELSFEQGTSVFVVLLEDHL